MYLPTSEKPTAPYQTVLKINLFYALTLAVIGAVGWIIYSYLLNDRDVSQQVADTTVATPTSEAGTNPSFLTNDWDSTSTTPSITTNIMFNTKEMSSEKQQGSPVFPPEAISLVPKRDLNIPTKVEDDDKIPPSTPSNLQAALIGSTNIVITWSPSTDNHEVAGYRIFKNGKEVGTTKKTMRGFIQLLPERQYTFGVSAFDNAGNSSSIQSISVRTSPLPSLAQSNIGTTTKGYTLRIVKPANGERVSGMVMISVEISSLSGLAQVAGVEYFVDGITLGPERIGSSNVYWDSSHVMDGEHRITARLRTTSGEYFMSPESIVITANGILEVAPPPTPPSATSPIVHTDTPPTVSITAPSHDMTISGIFTISANASDDTGVTGVQFLLDGTNFGPEDTSAPYTISWDTTLVANGTHTIAARARDTMGNESSSIPISVNVANGGTQNAYTISVTSTGFYSPNNITISAGDTVTFSYIPPIGDEVITEFTPNTIPPIKIDKEFPQSSRTFLQSGTWSFTAKDKNGNTGTIIVQ